MNGIYWDHPRGSTIFGLPRKHTTVRVYDITDGRLIVTGRLVDINQVNGPKQDDRMTLIELR